MKSFSGNHQFIIDNDIITKTKQKTQQQNNSEPKTFKDITRNVNNIPTVEDVLGIMNAIEKRQEGNLIV